jgi:uncharacterized protein with FMN-binding domain
MNKFLVLCVCCLAINCSYFTLNTAMGIYKKTIIENIDIRQVKDGTYVGYYDMLLVNALVRATVKEGILTKLDLLEHGYDKKHDGSAVIQQILKKQSLEVDGITGSTQSCRSILKATERALKTGLDLRSREQ